MKKCLAMIAILAVVVEQGEALATGGGTTPPQQPGIIEIDLGQSVYVDPVFSGVQGPCWYITNAGPAIPNGVTGALNSTGQRVVIPNYSASTWLSFRGNTGLLRSKVCCRPKPVTLCQVGGATPVTMTLPYTPYAQTQSPAAQCTDMWGKTYQDSETYMCSQTGSGVNADGLWVEQGSDGYTCSPNAFTSACSASCPQTVGTTETFDSCGNVQSVNGCTISCCTPSYSKSCNGSTATYTDVSCGTGSLPPVPGGCSLEEIGGFECAPAGGCADCNGGSDPNSCGGVTNVCPVGSKTCAQGCTLSCQSTWHPYGNAGACTVSLPCVNPTANPDGATQCPCEGWQ